MAICVVACDFSKMGQSVTQILSVQLAACYFLYLQSVVVKLELRLELYVRTSRGCAGPLTSTPFRMSYVYQWLDVPWGDGDMGML